VLMQAGAQDWAPEHYAKSLGHKVLETCWRLRAYKLDFDRLLDY
jgi:hypothetical protein